MSAERMMRGSTLKRLYDCALHGSLLPIALWELTLDAIPEWRGCTPHALKYVICVVVANSLPFCDHNSPCWSP